MAESREKLHYLARVDKERMMLEEIRNNYESYIYLIKNKLVDFEDEIAAVTTQEQRDALLSSASEAEDWMYDEGYDADLETYTKKYEELSAPAEKVFFRMKEVSARVDAIKELNEKLEKVESLMKKWETTMPHISEEERAEVISKVADVRKWIEEKTAAQAAADPTADPVFTSAEVPLQTTEIQKVVSKLSRKPKPAPKKEEETANTDEKKNETDASGDGDKKEESGSNETSEEGNDAESESKVESDEL
jgi:hypoxia up-regulated 1